ncbi:MAG: signal recognition particle-docking protein FtsY [Oscillospiraceae bacterium]|nr:signal recognition particle-docking protein FtsY [Oscillospiraceae bacterium]
MGLFSKIKAGLLKTRQAMMSKLSKLLHSFTKIDEDLFEQLEETLIMSDVGVDTSLEICDRLRKMIKEQGITDPKEIMRLIHEIVSDMMGEDQELDLSTTPSVIMVIGVNGAGKTTTIGKLCHKLKGEGKKVLVAAADTFRAAAIDQLQVWTERAGVDIVKHAEGSDAAAVVYDAITAAKARHCDVVIVDTAGRLHNKKNLMDELAKINRIVAGQAEGCAREILLVLDATTGQNAVNQAKLFSEVADITGIVLTKLDGTAKGGIVISIKNELGIPVKLVGLGEKIDDLQDFNSRDFVNALFGDEVLDGEVNVGDDEETYEETEEAEEDSEAAGVSEEASAESDTEPETSENAASEYVPQPSAVYGNAVESSEENSSFDDSADTTETVASADDEEQDEKPVSETLASSVLHFRPSAPASDTNVNTGAAEEEPAESVSASSADDTQYSAEVSASEQESAESVTSEITENAPEETAVSDENEVPEISEEPVESEEPEVTEDSEETTETEEPEVTEDSEETTETEESEETTDSEEPAEAEEETEEPEKKKGFFSRLFGKKKK